MAQLSGFFTSVGGDRSYTAGFFNQRLHEAFQRAEGLVAGCEGELAVSGTGGLSVTVDTGVAFKAGILYLNDAPCTLSLASLASGFRRIDRILVRLDRAARTILVQVVQGSSGMTPEPPLAVAATDILLARVLVDRSSGSYAISVTDERQYRAHFLTTHDSLDDVPDGHEWKKVRASVAEALNAGSFRMERTVFQYLARLGSMSEVCCLSEGSLGEILAGTAPEARIFRSADAGLSWTDMGRLGSEVRVCSMLALSGTVLVAGTGATGHIYRSVNGGNSWTDSGKLGTAEYVTALSTNLNNLGGFGTAALTLAGTVPGGNIFRSMDSGATWSTGGRPGNESGITALASLGGGIFLAGTEATARIYRSTDGGESWNLMARLQGEASTVTCFLFHGDGVILAGTGEGAEMHRSVDSGLTWEKMESLDECVAVNGFVRLDSGTILAAVEGSFGIWESRDQGVSWLPSARLATELGATAILKLYPDCVIAGTGHSGQIHRGSTQLL